MIKLDVYLIESFLVKVEGLLVKTLKIFLNFHGRDLE